MLLGVVSAFLHGACFPVAMFVFGDITNAFINREATHSSLGPVLCPLDPPQSGTLLIPDFSGTFNATPPDCAATYSFVNPITNGSCSDFTLQDVFTLTLSTQYECLTNDLFIDEVNRLVYIFIGIAAAAFLLGLLQIWFFRLAAERQVFKIRTHYYRALLSQELAWFEETPAGTINSYLSR